MVLAHTHAGAEKGIGPYEGPGGIRQLIEGEGPLLPVFFVDESRHVVVVGLQVIVQGSHEFRAQVEGRKVGNGQMGIAVNHREKHGQGGQGGGHHPVPFGGSQMTGRGESQQRERQEHHVFPEALHRCKGDGLPETAAVHLGPGERENKGDGGKKDHHHTGHPGTQHAQHARNQGYAHKGLHRAQEHTQHPGRRKQESQMEELEILRNDEHGAHRVFHFQKAGHQENNAQQDGRQAAQFQVCVLHDRQASTAARTLAKIASGGSMAPEGSLQSMRRKRASRRVSPRYSSRTLCWKAISASWISCAPSR